MEGMLNIVELNTLQSALTEMGAAHIACGFGVTLWATFGSTTCGGLPNKGVSSFTAFKGRH